MQKSPVLAGLFQDWERLALEGDRPRELDIRKPASQGAKAHCAHSTDAPLHWEMPGRYYRLALDCPGQVVSIGSAGLAVILRFAQWW